MVRYFTGQESCPHFYYIVETVKNKKKFSVAKVLFLVDKNPFTDLTDFEYVRHTQDGNIPVFKLKETKE